MRKLQNCYNESADDEEQLKLCKESFDVLQLRLKKRIETLNEDKNEILKACKDFENAIEQENAAKDNLNKLLEEARIFRAQEEEKNAIAQRMISKGLKPINEYQNLCKSVQESIDSTQSMIETIDSLWTTRKKIYQSLVDNIDTVRPVIAKQQISQPRR